MSADKSTISYSQAAALDVSEAAARVAVHRLRKRYRELLRLEIAQTLGDSAQVEEELRACSVLSSGSGDALVAATGCD